MPIDVSGSYETLRPLGILGIEVAVYSVFIFVFYRFLAKRDIITVDFSRYNNFGMRFVRWVGYLLQNVILFPVFVFLWFAIMALLLGFLGKNQTTDSILLVSAALVSAVRISAYCSESLSQDLAKMLPFALLGVYLVDQSYFEFEVSLNMLKGIPGYWGTLLDYFLFIVALEFVLRIAHAVVSYAKGGPAKAPVVQESDGRRAGR